MPAIPSNLESLPFKALNDLALRIERAKAKQYDAAVSELTQTKSKLDERARAMILEMAANLALPAKVAQGVLDAPVAKNGKGRHKPRKGKVMVKFRDPANAENTWSGRGRPARWLAVYEKQGHKREEYAVR